ncbi:MAG TPA: A24 family peptidase, partial [Polyangia bacterium]
MSYSVFTLLCATALLALVAGWDIARRRIPNWANAALGTTGLAAQAIHNGGWAVLSGTAAALITLVVLWVPWSKKRLGGGDVKATLCAATWLGL